MRCSHRAAHLLRQGSGPGPLSPRHRASGAPLPRRAYAQTQAVVRAWAPLGPFLPASRPPLRRGPCPCARPLRGGAPGPRFAGPLRRLAPALASLGWRARPSGLPPRLPRSARVRRCAAPWALAGPAALGLPSLRCGLPVRSALLRLGLPLALRVAPPGPPLGPPASRLRGRGPPPRGACAALRAACFGLRPPGAFLCSARLRACAITSGGGCQDHSQRPASRADLDRSRLRRCVIAKNP